MIASKEKVTFDSHFLRVSFEGEVPCVTMQWKGFATSEEFREGLNAGLKTVETEKCSNWLADLRKMEVIAPEDEAWSNENWFPRGLAGGIKKMALIPSEDVFNSLSVDSIMSKVEGIGLVIHYFSNVEEARQWLAKA